MTLVEFLTARIAEDEQWALAASVPYAYAIGNPQVPEGGVHWAWVVGENWEPVTPNPAEEEFVSIGDSWSCNLATVEEWQSVNGNWMMRRTYAGHIEEMDPSAAGHIARHDPARVLREVEAKRRIMARHSVGGESWGPDMCDGCGQKYGGWYLTVDQCPELRDLASAYADHGDYRVEWAHETHDG